MSFKIRNLIHELDSLADSTGFGKASAAEVIHNELEGAISVSKADLSLALSRIEKGEKLISLEEIEAKYGLDE